MQSKKLFIAILVILLGGIIFLALRGLWKSTEVRQAVTVQVANRAGLPVSSANVLPTLLGVDRPRTYLVLFLNNTEMRPGGGFIGTYAIVRMNQGLAELQKVGGTENIEKTSSTTVAVPPEPLQKYLKVSEWYFRDSNWSPDFSRASDEALTLFAREHDVPPGGFDGVIGLTPTVIEQMLKITGPISVNGLDLSADNVTERMEYQVEYGYKNQGISFGDRKQFLGAFGHALISKIKGELWQNWSSYFVLLQRMIDERQLVVHMVDNQLQDTLREAGWSGEMHMTDGDYLLWADANLGALKTDVAVQRSLSYSIAPTSSGYAATVQMNYQHTGHFDWRTSRYRDYVRVFVPRGSALLGVDGAMAADRSTEVGKPDQGIENGRQWFGAFISIEPGKSGVLAFHYLVAPSVVDQIKQGTYSLQFDKQIGTPANQLTLALSFRKNVVSANPGETPDKYGDNRYDVVTDTHVSKQFTVKLAP